LRQHTGITAWSAANIAPGYQENFTYDGNGNILTVYRAGATAGITDNLAYQYNRNAGGQLLDNKLNYLRGTGAASNFGPSQSANNYTYDPIGNLTNDNQAGVSNIRWTVYGKIDTLNSNSGTIAYTYDPAGQRATKTVSGVTTFYIRDAQGNTLALYDNKSNQVNWREQHLYGSSRIGMWTPNVNLANNNAVAVWDTLGHKLYELTNHLGNVLATVSDIRIPYSTDGTTIAYYLPDVTTAQDYYGFGGLMPGRTYTENSVYRYGFNGKENDNEAKGTGNQQDYGNRIYDPRVGRFLSIDPLEAQFPFYTPFQFSGNSPIANVDLDGSEPMPSTKGVSEGEAQTKSQTDYVNSKYPVKSTTQWFWHNNLGKYDAKSGWYTKDDYKGILRSFEKNYYTKKGEIIPYLTIGKLNPAAFDLGREVLKEQRDAAAKYYEVFPNGVPNPHQAGLEPIYIEFDIALLFTAPEEKAVSVAAEEELPMQLHHFATIKE
jgi:RHS repeat-associated protein